MKNCLVVYFSRTGMTRRVAEQIANTIGCDIEALHEARSREGLFGFARSVFEALTGRAPALLPTSRNPADYRVVILGTPVWAGHMSSPMRSYILQNKERFNQIATFSTMGGSGGEKVLSEVATLCGKQSIGELVVSDSDITCGRSKDAVLRFAQQGGPRTLH